MCARAIAAGGRLGQICHEGRAVDCLRSDHGLRRPGASENWPKLTEQVAVNAVNDVLGWLAHGMTEEEVLEEHPGFEKENFAAVYAFAADMAETAYGGR